MTALKISFSSNPEGKYQVLRGEKTRERGNKEKKSAVKHSEW